MKLKSLILLFLSAGLFISMTLASFAEIPDFEKWNTCRLFEVLGYGEESNSDYIGISMRVDCEYEINQIHFLVMANLKKSGDERNAGVKIKFNNIGTVKLLCDGSTDYDDNKFFAQIDNNFYDAGANDIWIEFTVGIKSGIPEQTVVELSLYDTEGHASNAYSIDISEYSEDEIPDPDSGEYPDRPDDKASKASAVKTAKIKTSKVKTTKYKTTKVKKTKSKSAKNSDGEIEIEYETDEATADINDFDDIRVSSEKNKLIIICAVSAAVFAAGGFAAGIANSRKKNNSRGEK